MKLRDYVLSTNDDGTHNCILSISKHLPHQVYVMPRTDVIYSEHTPDYDRGTKPITTICVNNLCSRIYDTRWLSIAMKDGTTLKVFIGRVRFSDPNILSLENRQFNMRAILSKDGVNNTVNIIAFDVCGTDLFISSNREMNAYLSELKERLVGIS